MKENNICTQKGKAYSIQAIVGAALKGQPLPVNENTCYDLTDEQIKEALFEKSPYPDDERLFDLTVIADNADRLEVQSELIDLENNSYLARCEAQFISEKNRSELIAKQKKLEREQEQQRIKAINDFISQKGGIKDEAQKEN